MKDEGNKWRQVWVAAVVNISSITVGTCLGWTSPMNPKLKDQYASDTPLNRIPTSTEESWIGSLVALGALMAPYVAGPLAGQIGRKWTLLGSTTFFIISYVMLLFSSTVGLMMAARLLQGFGVGFVMTATPMYIGEIASVEARGGLGSFMQLFITIGILYVYCIGPYVSYALTQYLCIAVAIVFFATFAFMPESPTYYLTKGMKEEAIESLKFLRGKSGTAVQDEVTTMQLNIEEAMAKKTTITDVFSNSANLKALIISAGLAGFQQLSGINAVLFYSTDIFIAATASDDGSAGGSIDPAISSILVGVVMVVSSAITPLIADRLGRKVILLFSAFFMAVSQVALGFSFLASNSKWEIAASITWLPVTSMIVFVLVYCVGFGSLPWAVMGEMFAPEVKSVASSLVTSTCWIMGFLVTQYFGPVSTAFGAHWAFWIFAIFCVCAFVFVNLLMFETKGLTLQEIQDRLNGR